MPMQPLIDLVHTFTKIKVDPDLNEFYNTNLWTKVSTTYNVISEFKKIFDQSKLFLAHLKTTFNQSKKIWQVIALMGNGLFQQIVLTWTHCQQ